MDIASPDWENLITEGAKTFNIHVDRQAVRQFGIHARELIKWNKKVNLTAIVDPREVAFKHFLDSIIPARWIPPTSSLLDVGSGGGFPGIPLKILIPSLAVTLIDGSRKKINFLKHIIRTLQLRDIDACQIRAEELAKDSDGASRFTVIISRALSSWEAFVRLALPLLAEQGMIIALTGDMGQQGVDGLRTTVFEKILSSTNDRHRFSLVLENYKLPVIFSKRSILIVRKTSRALCDFG